MTTPESSTRAPGLAEVVVHHVEQALEELHTFLPAVVMDYDATLQRATVKPLIKHAYRDENGVRQVETLQPIPGVSVQSMAAGGFALTCPISTGSNGLGPATTGTLFFSEASLDAWKSGSGAEVDPVIDHRHALSDGVFVPGLNPFGAPLAGVPTDHAALGAVNGVRVHLRQNVITIGDEAGSAFLARADKVSAQLAAFNTALAAAMLAQAGNPPGLAALTALQTALATPPWPGDVAATQAKGK